MSKCLFPYDFFQDGRSDVLAEVRLAQSQGLWTKKKHACWLKEAVSTYKRLKHNSPDQVGISYFAGRVAALKSELTLDFPSRGASPSSREEVGGKAAYYPLKPDVECFCDIKDCWNDAVWGICFPGETRPYVLLCDPCRQEWQRADVAYITVSGWDWDEDEYPLSIPRSETRSLVQRPEDALMRSSVVLPLSFLLGCHLSSFLLHGSHPVMITELLIVLTLHWQRKNIARLLFSPYHGRS